MVAKKTAKTGARSASQKLNQTRRDVRGVSKTATKTASRVEQHSDKFAEVLERLHALEAKVKKMMTDPIVMVPHETKRRVDGIESQIEGLIDSLALKASQRSLDETDEKLGTVEHSVSEHLTTLDNHEDRIDALEDSVTSTDTPRDASVKCRCIPELSGKDPDCYVHGESFDKSDRPSTTKAPAAEVNAGNSGLGEEA